MIHSCLLDSSRLSQQVSGGIPDEKLRYLDPEGGYEDPDEGFRAELAAMTGQPKVSINALPTQAYLDATIVPTVMKALHEVCHARPDNPLEFVAYYILKHNPNRQGPSTTSENNGAPAGDKQ